MPRQDRGNVKQIRNHRQRPQHDGAAGADVASTLNSMYVYRYVAWDLGSVSKPLRPYRLTGLLQAGVEGLHVLRLFELAYMFYVCLFETWKLTAVRL